MKKRMLSILGAGIFIFSLAGVVNAAPVITNGLVAAYEFNGNANDTSGSGNHGTVYGATLTTDPLGSSNSAYHFDGMMAMTTF